MKINKHLGALIGFLLVGLTGFSQAGSTFTNPAVIASLPYSATTETTCGFGDNYTTADIACTGNYLGGDEKIYSFTPSSNLTNVEVTMSNVGNTWTGLFITDDSTTTGTCMGSVANSSTANRVISGLTMNAGTTYYILVSSWPSPQCVTSYDLSVTAITCPQPTALGVNGVTLTSAYPSWTEAGSATSWQIEYGTSGFAQGTGTLMNASTNSDTITGLTAATNYQYYVRSVCGAADSSNWSGPFGFYTGYCQPNPISVDGQGIVNVSMGSINNATSTETGNYGDYSSMSTNVYQGTSFNVSITYQTGYTYNTWAWVDWNGDLDFDDAGEAFYIGNSANTNPATITGTIAVPATANLGSLRIRLGGADTGLGSTPPSNPCYTGSWGSFEDYTINVNPAPTCPWPDTLNVSNVLANTADFSWVEMGSATSWEVEYGSLGFTPGMGTSSIETTTTASLSSLSVLTNYQVYVRAICGSGDSSIWVGPMGFTTACVGPLSGTYTMDPTAAVSNTNFISMADFKQAVDICGLGGPVVLNVNAGSDTLVGPWDLTAITGASATNTLTINGNNALVHKNPSANHFVRLEGTKHLTINGFNFVNQTPATPMYGFQMKDGCDSIAISNNTINVGMAYTSSLSAGIVSSNSTSNAYSYGNNANNVLVSNNEIIGGYYGIRFNGTSTSVKAHGNTIMNNTIRDFYYYGAYLYYADSVFIDGNDMSRNQRTTAGTGYGIYAAYATHCSIQKNKIHDFGSTTGTFYGMQLRYSDNVVGKESEIINNVMYNVAGSSTSYGIYLFGTKSYINIYHNTIDIETAGSSSKYGIYNTSTTTDINVKNNLVNMHGSGTGSAYGLFYSTSGATLLTDNNNVHVNSSGTNYYGRWSANRSTLSDFQTASSQAANSNETDPVLTDVTNGDYTPLSMAVDNMGAVLGVTTDISGATRSTTTPDVGALEFTGIPGDLGATDVMLARVSDCYGTADTAFVQVSNVLATVADFTTNPLTIVWNVTGPVNTTDSLTVNTGSLAGNSDSIFSISTINMSIPGSYDVSVYIKPNAGNPIAANDSIFNGHSETVSPILVASPDTITLTSPWDSAQFNTQSPLYPISNPYFTERCQFASSTYAGVPSTIPTYIPNNSDYVEITGVPNTGLDGFTYELWVSGTKRITHVFGASEVFSANGTMILSTTGGGSSSPSDHYWVTATSYDAGSSTASGSILKDANGNVVDALGYASFTFPASSGVTASDWSGTGVSGSSSWGIRLEGADVNGPTNWSKTSNTNRQDPNVVNASVIVPTSPTVAGISWDSAGTTVGTDPTFFGGPYNMDGTHTYVVTYTNACGTFMDTVVAMVDLTKAMMTDSTMITCNGANDGAATVAPSGGDAPYTYIWDNGDTTAMADSLTPGAHTVTVYDANNWPATASVTITEPVTLTASTSTMPSTCGVPSGSATVIPAGGTMPYTYAWSDSQTTATAASLTGGGYSVTVTDANMCSIIASATVSDIGAPTISIAVDSVVACFGDSSGVVTASAIGGTTPYNYAWSSGGMMATENGLPVGIHTVTLTDNSGCVATSTVTMTQNTPLLAIVNGTTNPACNGDATGTATSIAGGGVAPYVYSWSSGDMSANAMNLAAGSYTLTVTDAVGCMQTTSVIVTQPNPLSGAFVNAMDVSCNGGSNGMVEMLNAGGTAPYTLSWSNGSSSNSASGLSAGYVSVTVTDANNCMLEDSINITEPTALTSAASVTSDVLCNGGNTGSASVSAAGGTMPLVYGWSNGAGGMSATGLTAGTYSVSVTDGNNCQTTSSVTVTEPTALAVSVSGTDVSCYGMNDGTAMAMASGATAPYSYSWNTGASTASLSSLGMGMYSVDVTDANGCMMSGMTTIDEPMMVTVSLGADQTLCDGDSLDIDAGAGFASYTWSTGDTTSSAGVNSNSLGAGSTTVSVMVTDAAGCMGSDSMVVTVSDPVMVAMVGDNELCMYEIGNLDAGPGHANYMWSNGSTSQLIRVYPTDMTVGSNTYTVTVTNDLGCDGVGSFDVELHPEVIFNLPADTSVWKDSVFTIMADSGYASYLWNTNEVSQSITVGMPGTYTCIVTDSITGCEGNDAIVIDFNVGIGSVEIAELKLYPNPASEFINLEFNNFSSQGMVEVELLSITGQLVRSINVDVSSTNGTQTIDVSNLAVGTYIVTFQYENERVVKQFTIK